MLIKKDILKEDIQKCMLSNNWDFGNSILYEMCEKNPYHQSASIIVGKIWLIGRSYAAAIERRKNAELTDSGDDFYFNDVAPKMLNIGTELDARISELKKYDSINEANLKDVIETHSFLTETFSDISGMNKRSLASKYLHFHVPHMFYIYDSRAVKQARKLINSNISLRSKLQKYGDKEYTDLSTRLLGLQSYIFEKYQLKVTPRVIDAFLLR